MLNRAVVLAKVEGAEKALSDLDLIKKDPLFESYHFFYSTEAELFIQLGQHGKAATSLEKAIRLAPLKSIKNLLDTKRKYCLKRAFPDDAII